MENTNRPISKKSFSETAKKAKAAFFANFEGDNMSEMFSFVSNPNDESCVVNYAAGEDEAKIDFFVNRGISSRICASYEEAWNFIIGERIPFILFYGSTNYHRIFVSERDMMNLVDCQNPVLFYGSDYGIVVESLSESDAQLFPFAYSSPSLSLLTKVEMIHFAAIDAGLTHIKVGGEVYGISGEKISTQWRMGKDIKRLVQFLELHFEGCEAPRSTKLPMAAGLVERWLRAEFKVPNEPELRSFEPPED